jgi:DNA relaxase NicK
MPSDNPHERLNRRSLALHRAIAARLRQEPRLVQQAIDNLIRWKRSADGPWIAEWMQLLNGDREMLLALLEQRSETADRLRQSSPFTGILDATERKRIIESFAA